MREIKFEYGFESINGIVKKKYYLHEIPNIKEKCDVWNMLPIIYVRQFTGLKDKKGVDIYEGDILNDEYGSYGVVFWNKDDASFSIDYKHIDCQSFLNVDEWAEVIGNIHENKNLLNNE